jgi:UTP--glucose-1-phosphate uridylyltransferase
MSQNAALPSQPLKAVIPAAGLATRFLPATKAVPKELLPMVDRPVLQIIVEEAAGAGINDILLITGRGKTSMVDHFDRSPYLESRLAEKNDTDRLAAIKRPAELAEIYTCRQPEPLGLGDAISYAESHVAAGSVVVMLPDEFLEEDRPMLPAMRALHERTGGIVVGLFEIRPEESARYGVVAIEDTNEYDDVLEHGHGPIYRLTNLVEKPPPADAPSNLAVSGRYIMPPTIFDALRRTKPGADGEIQFTDALALMVAEGTPAHGIVYRGVRFDTGQPLGYVQAVVQMTLRQNDIGEAFGDWLKDYVSRLP